MARRLGAEEPWIAAARRECPEDAARDEGSEQGLAAGWTAALRYAEALTRGGGDVQAAVYDELSRHWSDGQIVEVTMVIGLFNYFNRFNTALCIEITR